MKTIFKQFFNQESAIDSQEKGTERLFFRMKEFPAIVLWLIWFSYLFLDLFLRRFGNHQIADWKVIVLHFVAWGIINQYWFFVFLPNSILHRKWLKELWVFLVLYSAYLFLKVSITLNLPSDHLLVLRFLVNEAARSMHFLVVTSAMWGFYFSAKRQDRMRKLEIHLSKLRIEHNSLQLSSHFVLNTISQFLTSILKISRPLFLIFNQFTEVLSYNYKDTKQANTLAQEIHAMENYIACQRYRFSDRLQFLVSKKIGNLNASALSMPKWTLMTLLENVFKHGDYFNPECPCSLAICLDTTGEGRVLLSLSITNPLAIVPAAHSSEFGIKTVSRILEYYFPGNTRIHLEKTSSEFNLLLLVYYERYSENRDN